VILSFSGRAVLNGVKKSGINNSNNVCAKLNSQGELQDQQENKTTTAQKSCGQNKQKKREI
jgi:hypothetical protein